MEADTQRRKLHPEGVVTYIIDRNINYTNFCTEYCTFCAFYRPLKGPKAKEGRDGRTWRHWSADARRIASRSQDRLAREDVAWHQTTFPQGPPALLLSL